MSFQIDDIDKKIVSELQVDADQSLKVIIKKVSSSKSQVWN
tara:strand:- start:47 stop:169 length:123 start_codon:yes stop_codon:yes gene_type:complete